jgi:hypothetical protein
MLPASRLAAEAKAAGLLAESSNLLGLEASLRDAIN